MFDQLSEEPNTNHFYTNNLKSEFEWCKDKDDLCIDAILTTVADFTKIANEWHGKSATFMEIEPSKEQLRELRKWKGERINLDLCNSASWYDLGMFFDEMNNWEGNTISIGYTGPFLFTENSLHFIKHPKYKELRFEGCTLPDGYVDTIITNNPDLNVVVLDDEEL